VPYPRSDLRSPWPITKMSGNRNWCGLFARGASASSHQQGPRYGTFDLRQRARKCRRVEHLRAQVDRKGKASGRIIMSHWTMTTISSSPPAPSPSASAGSRADLVMRLQGKLKRGARPLIERGPDRSAVALDYRAADRQPHAHAARLGREEGVE
jgi:hypothetical protein